MVTAFVSRWRQWEKSAKTRGGALTKLTKPLRKDQNQRKREGGALTKLTKPLRCFSPPVRSVVGSRGGMIMACSAVGSAGPRHSRAVLWRQNKLNRQEG